MSSASSESPVEVCGGPGAEETQSLPEEVAVLSETVAEHLEDDGFYPTLSQKGLEQLLKVAQDVPKTPEVLEFFYRLVAKDEFTKAPGEYVSIEMSDFAYSKLRAYCATMRYDFAGRPDRKFEIPEDDN